MCSFVCLLAVLPCHISWRKHSVPQTFFPMVSESCVLLYFVHGDKIVTFESSSVLLSMVAFLGSPSAGVGECHRWLMLLLGTRVQDPQHMEQLKPSPTNDFIAPLHL